MSALSNTINGARKRRTDYNRPSYLHTDTDTRPEREKEEGKKKVKGYKRRRERHLRTRREVITRKHKPESHFEQPSSTKKTSKRHHNMTTNTESQNEARKDQRPRTRDARHVPGISFFPSLPGKKEYVIVQDQTHRREAQRKGG